MFCKFQYGQLLKIFLEIVKHQILKNKHSMNFDFENGFE